MPICIECSYPVPQLYHVLHGRHTPPPPSSLPSAPSFSLSSSMAPPSAVPSAAAAPVASAPLSARARREVELGSGGGDGRRGGEGAKRGGGGGGDVRLTQCPRCRRFADKYVEHDFVVLFIDLVLVKPQVYRHLLFNRLGREDDALDPSITRLGILLLLFDVYLTWSRIESSPVPQTARSPIPTLPILLQYCFYLTHSVLTTLAQHLVVRWLAPKWNPVPPPPQPAPTPSALSTALFVSSNMKLFPLLMVVWKYDDPTRAINRGVAWAVAVQNLEALRILLGCGYWVAAALVAAGWLAAWAVGVAIRGAVGLEG